MNNRRNYIKNTSIFWSVFISLMVGCIKANSQNEELPNALKSVLEITLNPKETIQTIHNFGASDAWATQTVGANWPVAIKEKIATLLFSSANKADGSPEGIGLNAWRFNIGAGSAEQGEDSQIESEWRRSESFLNSDGTYNWNKQAGQVWFLEKAKTLGVKTFVGFVNSPPVFFTKNEKAWSDDGKSSNLKEENYTKYANFLSEVVNGIQQKTGITFDYISPFNEPQWEWNCCKQEGSPWNNEELFKAIKAIDASFQKNKVSSKIEIPETAHIEYMYSEDKRPESRSNQIAYFFDENSPGYVGNLNSVAHKVAGHSYFTTWDKNALINHRKALDEKIKTVDPSLEYWMSEYCVLEDNEVIKGSGRDLGIASALYIARVIHSDLVIANASAWHWWLAVSPYDYKDGLIYIDDAPNGGNYYDSKMLWALGHYSRFVRPEMKRMVTSRSDGLSLMESIDGILPSAYASDQEIVVVFVNQLKQAQEIKITGVPKEFKTMEIYQTTSDKEVNLKKTLTLNTNETFTLPKQSLMTCVLKKGS